MFVLLAPQIKFFLGFIIHSFHSQDDFFPAELTLEAKDSFWFKLFSS